MSLNKQSDVKNHLSRHTRSQIHLIEPISQPDATGFSDVEPGLADSIAAIAVEDTLKQGSTSEADSDSTHAVPTEISKRVKA